jgi:hypothetical protein
MSEKTQYIVRVESARANTYGLGEQVVPGVHLFRSGHYGLSKEELEQVIKSTNIKQGPKQ